MAQTLFQPGQIVATPGALELSDQGVQLMSYIGRHLRGDWGDLGDEDKQENNLSVSHGYRILSAYNTMAGRLWIITEADRSTTTLLLPEEY
jgi:hypothetical protein